MDEQYRQFEGMRKFRPLDHVLFLPGKKKKNIFWTWNRHRCTTSTLGAKIAWGIVPTSRN
jgi:hypothetical protein